MNGTISEVGNWSGHSDAGTNFLYFGGKIITYGVADNCEVEHVEPIKVAISIYEGQCYIPSASKTFGNWNASE